MHCLFYGLYEKIRLGNTFAANISPSLNLLTEQTDAELPQPIFDTTSYW